METDCEMKTEFEEIEPPVFLNVCNIINLSHLCVSASHKKCVRPVPDSAAITESHQCLNASQYSIQILHSNNIQNMHYSIYLLSPRITPLAF